MGMLPAFLLLLKRYAAQVVQGCWENWCGGLTLERVSEQWWIRCVRTVQRWLRPLVRDAPRIAAELRRLWHLEEQQAGRSELLQLVRQAACQSSPFRHATPYSYVQAVLRALDSSLGP